MGPELTGVRISHLLCSSLRHTETTPDYLPTDWSEISVPCGWEDAGTPCALRTHNGEWGGSTQEAPGRRRSGYSRGISICSRVAPG